jgi:hypothetical protein
VLRALNGCVGSMIRRAAGVGQAWGDMFVAIYFAHKRTLDDADIQEVADSLSLKKQARSIDEFVTEKYSLSFDGAIQRLDELQKSVAVFIAMVKCVQRPDDPP